MSDSASTLFRKSRSAGGRDVIGDAVVVAVRIDSATIRIDRVNDAISPGDWAAPQTVSSIARQQQGPNGFILRQAQDERVL